MIQLYQLSSEKRPLDRTRGRQRTREKCDKVRVCYSGACPAKPWRSGEEDLTKYEKQIYSILENNSRTKTIKKKGNPMKVKRTRMIDKIFFLIFLVPLAIYSATKEPLDPFNIEGSKQADGSLVATVVWLDDPVAEEYILETSIDLQEWEVLSVGPPEDYDLEDGWRSYFISPLLMNDERRFFRGKKSIPDP
jgi:hypothetical protein